MSRHTVISGPFTTSKVFVLNTGFPASATSLQGCCHAEKSHLLSSPHSHALISSLHLVLTSFYRVDVQLGVR